MLIFTTITVIVKILVPVKKGKINNSKIFVAYHEIKFMYSATILKTQQIALAAWSMYVVVSSPPATEEIGAMGREIKKKIETKKSTVTGTDQNVCGIRSHDLTSSVICY
jgi:hypothetical protein